MLKETGPHMSTAAQTRFSSTRVSETPAAFKSLRSVLQWEHIHAITLLLIAVTFLSTLRQGHGWGDDFAQYLLHARNIAEGRPYSDTGYLYNTENPVVGPKAYPPLFSVALAPIAYGFGLNLAAYKSVMVLLFVASLALAGRLFARDICGRDIWILLLITGCSPVYWEVKDAIISEHLFTLLWYGSLLIADDWYRKKKVYGNPLIHGLILGSAVFLTCFTRTVGIVLLPVLVACELLIARTMTRVGVVALLSATTLLVLERLLIPASGSGYLEQLKSMSVSQIVSNFLTDLKALTLLWQYGSQFMLGKLIALTIVGCAVVGYLRSNFRSLSPLGIGVAAYFGLVVIWPSAEGLRMVLPLFPALVFYTIWSFSSLKSRPQMQLSGPLVLLFYSVVSFTLYYSNAKLGTFQSGVETQQAQELFEYVRNHTQNEDVVLFYKPRALALYTRNRSSAYPVGISESQFWNYVDKVHAEFVVVRPDASAQPYEDQTYEMVADLRSERFQEVFRNQEFRVLRVLPTRIARG